MAPKKVKQAPRQHIDYRPRWSIEVPIIIDDATEATPGRIFKKSYVAFKNRRGMEEEPSKGVSRPHNFRGLVNGTKPVGSTQKQTHQHLGEEDAGMDQNHSGSLARKRTRHHLDEEDGVVNENHIRPLKRARYGQVTSSEMIQREETSHATYRQNLEATLFTMWKETDKERAAAKELQTAREQAQLQAKRDQALEAESRKLQRRSDLAANLKSMQQEYDRKRQISLELQKAEEQEKLEQQRIEKRDAEAEKARHRSFLQDRLKTLWQIHDANNPNNRTLGFGQLTERGKKRVEERREAQARQAARRA